MPAQVAVPVRPSDPPFFQPLAARSQDGWENPRNWGGRWADRRQAAQHLWDMYHRQDAQGNFVQRIILEPEMRSVDAHGDMGVGPGADWTAIDPYLKHVIIEVTMERRKEDRAAGRDEITVGFYNGYLNDGMPGLIRNHTNEDVTDLLSDTGLERFKTKWEPWIECGVLSELNHDAGVKSWEKVKLLLFQQYARFGLYGLTEAIRWDDNSGQYPNRYDWSAYDNVDMWCISRYILSRDPIGQLAWPWAHPLQPGENDDDRFNQFGQPAHVYIMNSAHTYNVPGEPEPVEGLLTEEQARDYENRGWTVGSWSNRHESDLMVNLPPIPQPQPGPRRVGDRRP